MLVFLSFIFSCNHDDQSFDYVVQTDLSSPEAEAPADNTPESTPSNEDNEQNDVEPNPSSEEQPSTSDDSAICAAEDEGTRTGDCAQNFSLSDINGDTVALHDFHGQVIFLDLSSFN